MAFQQNKHEGVLRCHRYKSWRTFRIFFSCSGGGEGGVRGARGGVGGRFSIENPMRGGGVSPRRAGGGGGGEGLGGCLQGIFGGGGGKFFFHQEVSRNMRSIASGPLRFQVRSMVARGSMCGVLTPWSHVNRTPLAPESASQTETYM